MIQIPLALLSLAAIWCTLEPELQKWGPLLGLLSQPFWLTATYRARQWGMFFLAFVYSLVWCKGIYQFWYV